MRARRPEQNDLSGRALTKHGTKSKHLSAAWPDARHRRPGGFPTGRVAVAAGAMKTVALRFDIGGQRATLAVIEWAPGAAPLGPIIAGPQRNEGGVGMTTRVATGARSAWLAGLLATALAVPALAASETTADRLLNAGAEPQNWLTHHKDYAATRYSTLDQITKDNVKDLKVAWTFALGGIEGGGIWPHGGLEGTPIVEDGAMYVTDGWGAVYKLDVSQGPGQAGMEDGSGHRQGLVGRGVLLRRQQPRRRAVAGQGDLAHPGRPAARDRQGDRRGRLGAPGRRSGDRRGDHRGAAGGQGPGDHRRLGRGVRHPRLDRRDRPEHRQGGVAPAYHSRVRASPDTTPGRTITTPGRPAAARPGSPAPTIRRPT